MKTNHEARIAELEEANKVLNAENIELKKKFDKIKDKTKSVKNNQSAENQELFNLSNFSLKLASLPSYENLQQFIIKELCRMTNASLGVFNVYDSKRKVLKMTHIETNSNLINEVVKVIGPNILKTESPVDDEIYKMIVSENVGIRKTFTDLTFGAIPSSVDKILRKLTGFDRFYIVSFFIENELFGTSMIAFKPEQVSPSHEFLYSFGKRKR